MHLIEILQKHNTHISLALKPGTYTDWWAHLNFLDNKITVQIYDDEGNGFETTDDMPVEWIEAISNLVAELKEAQQIPDYTLELPTKTE